MQCIALDRQLVTAVEKHQFLRETLYGLVSQERGPLTLASWGGCPYPYS